MTYAWHPFRGREFAVRAYGRGELVRCFAVDDPGSASILLPLWMFDPVACAAMRRTSDASASIAALEELRRLLIEAHALDTRPTARHTAAHAQTSSPSGRPTEPTAPAPVPSGMEQPARNVSPGGRHAARRTAEAAHVDARDGRSARRRR